MRSRRDKAESRIFRPISALLALTAGVGLSVAIAWGSSTELGETVPVPGYTFTNAVVVASTVPGSASYTTPDGVLTRWKYQSGSGAGTIKLKVFRFTGTAGVYEVVGEGSFHAVDPNKSYEFHEQIAVKQGYLLGLVTQGAAQAGTTITTTVPGTTTDDLRKLSPADPPVGSTGGSTTGYPNSRLGIAATVESDADKDGFGDDTQDKCTTDASTHDACPTAADKTAPTLTLGGSTKQKLGSSVVVSVTCNEACSVDGSGSVSTSKPKASKRLSLKKAKTLGLTANTSGKLKLKLSKKSRGKIKRNLRHHGKATATITITAKDPAGNATVAKRKIKLKK